MLKLISLLSLAILLSGCVINNHDKVSPLTKELFLNKYKTYIRDIQEKKFPGNIENHYTQRRVEELTSYANGDIKPKDVVWEVQSSYMPISSIEDSFFKVESEKTSCLTVIGKSFQGENMYVNILFVNQAGFDQTDFEWRMEKILGAVFTEKVKPEFPDTATCPDNS